MKIENKNGILSENSSLSTGLLLYGLYNLIDLPRVTDIAEDEYILSFDLDEDCKMDILNKIPEVNILNLPSDAGKLHYSFQKEYHAFEKCIYWKLIDCYFT